MGSTETSRFPGVDDVLGDAVNHGPPVFVKPVALTTNGEPVLPSETVLAAGASAPTSYANARADLPGIRAGMVVTVRLTGMVMGEPDPGVIVIEPE